MFASVIEGDILDREARDSKHFLENKLQCEIARKSCKGEKSFKNLKVRTFRFYEYSDDKRRDKRHHYTYPSGWSRRPKTQYHPANLAKRVAKNLQNWAKCKKSSKFKITFLGLSRSAKGFKSSKFSISCLKSGS